MTVSVYIPVDLGEALQLALQINGGDSDGLREEKDRLCALLLPRMQGVRLGLRLDKNGDLQKARYCDEETLPWLKLYEDIESGNPWRVCRGCSLPFAARNPLQKYHDNPCRLRFAQRQHRERIRSRA